MMHGGNLSEPGRIPLPVCSSLRVVQGREFTINSLVSRESRGTLLAPLLKIRRNRPAFDGSDN